MTYPNHGFVEIDERISSPRLVPEGSEVALDILAGNGLPAGLEVLQDAVDAQQEDARLVREAAGAEAEEQAQLFWLERLDARV
jgi:hypothetical protein